MDTIEDKLKLLYDKIQDALGTLDFRDLTYDQWLMVFNRALGQCNMKLLSYSPSKKEQQDG